MHPRRRGRQTAGMGEERIAFTISVGLAACVPEPDKSFNQLIRAADEALYAAKEAGRNCVIVAAPGYQDGVLASPT